MVIQRVVGCPGHPVPGFCMLEFGINRFDSLIIICCITKDNATYNEQKEVFESYIFKHKIIISLKMDLII